MRYELLLQSADPGQPFDAPAVERALVVQGFVRGEATWRLPSGEVEVGPLMEAGQQVATEVRIPLTDREDLVREAVHRCAQIASASGAKLVDPQLGRGIAENDEGAVADQYTRTARYAGEMLGIPEAVTAAFAPAPEGFLRPGTKVLLGIIVFLVGLYLVANALLSRL